MLLLLVLPLLLAVGVVVALALAVAAGCSVGWRWLRGRTEPDDPTPAAPRPPERILATPTLVLELLDLDDHPLPPALAALSEAWSELVDEEHGFYYLLRTTPELPGLHGQLVTNFRYAWHGGLLLQLLQAAPDASAPTSFLVLVDPPNLSWERIEEVGMFSLYRRPEFPANYLEGWNRRIGQLQLHLEPGKATTVPQQRQSSG